MFISSQKTLLVSILLLAMALAQGDFLIDYRELGYSNSDLPDYYGNNLTIAFSSSLGCGACLRGGYVYCTTAKTGQIYQQMPTSKCCKDKTSANCNVISNSAYTCSSSLNSTTLKQSICPFVSTECGIQNNFTLNKTGDSLTINVSVNSGNTCFYTVSSKCGLPSFKPNNSAGFDIQFFDYYDSELSKSNSTNGTQPQNQTNQSHPTNGAQGNNSGQGSNMNGGGNQSSNGSKPTNGTQGQQNQSQGGNNQSNNIQSAQNKSQNSRSGPTTGRYNPSNKTSIIFTETASASQCGETRHLQVAMTSFAGVNVTSSAKRVLAETINSMGITIESQDVSNLQSSSSVFIQLAYISLLMISFIYI